MTVAPPRIPWVDAASQVALHACRSQEELERAFADGLEKLLAGVCGALCLAASSGDDLEVRVVVGDGCGLQAGQRVAPAAATVPDEQRFAVTFQHHRLGELWLSAKPRAQELAVLLGALTHLGAALVNLALNGEVREATDEYCATLQALEEGIVLFQEPDAEALTARLLALASGMVGASAGALYVLDEVGNDGSELRLQQALGIPEALLETLHGVDGAPWPVCLLDAPAQVDERGQDGAVAGLDPACTPSVLERVATLPLRYHGVQAGVCVLFNPRLDAQRDVGRLQSFGQLAAALLHRLSLERLREAAASIERELEIAQTIQERLTPSAPPPSDDYEFAWRSEAAKRIGGDYVDLMDSDLGDLHAIVADASGHGINSALLTTSFRANYRGNAAWLDPAELAASLNHEVVHEVGPTGMFLTAAMVKIEAESRRLSICSAGHNPAMIYRAATGEVEAVASHGPPLGFVAAAEFETYEGELLPGDVLLLYTDGVTEAADQNAEMFGEERLAQVLLEHAPRGAAALLDAALAEVARFTAREDHDDDLSLMVIRRR